MIGQHKRVFDLAPYQEDWADHFVQEARRIRSALGDRALQIEHIGSTSIPGMPAKPIIDIMVAVDELAPDPDLVVPLDALGYVYHPFDTVAGRLFFARESEPEIRTHHLSLTRKGSDYWINQLLFRDSLRVDDQLAAEYVQLKVGFAAYYTRTNHVDIEWKSAFIAEVLEKAKSAGLDGNTTR